jgi:hypothetical protein
MEKGGPTMLPRIGVMRASNRNVVREFDPLADGTAATPGIAPRAAASTKIRSRKQKDADQQTCCKCPEA